MGELKSKDGSLHLEGFVELELVGPNRKHVIRKNTITNAGKQFLLGISAGNIMRIGASEFGVSAVTGEIDYFSSNKRASNQNYDLTNVLAYMQDEQNGLTASSTLLNLLDTEMQNQEKLIGYGRSSLIPLANGKEGSIDNILGQYVVDPFTVARRWKYPEGVASGTIDTIAMMPASYVMNNHGYGLRFSKLLDNVNPQYQNFGSGSTGFFPPGVTGITATDEILLNYSVDGKSLWKYNMSTGEVSQSDLSIDNMTIVSGASCDYYVEGNYLYTLTIAQAVGYNSYINVYSLPDLTRVAQITLSSIRGYNACFLKDDSGLYLVSSNGSSARIYTLVLGASGYYSSLGTDYYTFASTPMGIVLPEGLTDGKVLIKNYGSKYLLIVPSNANSYYDGYIFETLNSPKNTITGLLSNINFSNDKIFSSGGNSGILSLGLNTSQYSPDKTWTYSSADGTGTAPSGNGVWLTLDGWTTNVMSFVKLDQPIQKGDSDVLYVTYGYKVV